VLARLYASRGVQSPVDIETALARLVPPTELKGCADAAVLLADAIADEAVEMTAYENFVTEEGRKGRSILGLYPATDEQSLADFAAWRKQNGR
ncbi:hypothetical protein MAQ58_23420, partial [Enterobacter sp. DRP3]|nr:hypothetical protein [Enterobacter sp. DRP3]